MADNIRIEPGAVADAGKNVDDGTTSARAEMSGLFDTAGSAVTDNPGFSVNAALTKVAHRMEESISATLTDLEQCAESIINGAHGIAQVDQGAADDLSRIGSTMNEMGGTVHSSR